MLGVLCSVVKRTLKLKARSPKTPMLLASKAWLIQSALFCALSKSSNCAFWHFFIFFKKKKKKKLK